MEGGRQLEKRPGEDGKPGLVNSSSSSSTSSLLPSSSSAAGLPSTDRPPLLPLNADLGPEGERRSRDATAAGDEKDRRVGEAEDRDRQNREQRAGFHPLQQKPLNHVSGHMCQICTDDVGITSNGELFVACKECGFLVCRPCYENEPKGGNQTCPQCKTRYKRHKGSLRVNGDDKEDDVDDLEHDFQNDADIVKQDQQQVTEAMPTGRMTDGRPDDDNLPPTDLITNSTQTVSDDDEQHVLPGSVAGGSEKKMVRDRDRDLSEDYADSDEELDAETTYADFAELEAETTVLARDDCSRPATVLARDDRRDDRSRPETVLAGDDHSRPEATVPADYPYPSMRPGFKTRLRIRRDPDVLSTPEDEEDEYDVL